MQSALTAACSLVLRGQLSLDTDMNITLKQYSTQLANLGKNCGFVLEERRKAFLLLFFRGYQLPRERNKLSMKTAVGVY